MLRAVQLLFPLLAWSQVTKPPEFEQPSVFRTAPQAGLDGTSHVSAQQRRLSASLLSYLSRMDLTSVPASERDSFIAGRRLLDQSMAAAALQHFQTAVRQYPQSMPLRLAHAVTLYLASKPDDGASEVLAINGDSPTLVPFLGEFSAASSQHAPAMEKRLRQIASANPRNGEARYYLATVLARNQAGASKEAEDLLQESAKLDSTDPRPCLELARVESDRNNTDAAIGWLEEALKRDPNLAEAHYRLSRLYFRAGKQEESDRHLERFRALSKQAAR
jgi:tetratricopeptide (TPR) repeat protein